MAAPVNTTASTAFRSREDLDKIMTFISPTDTPMLSMMGTHDIDNRTPEWTTEALRASDADNAAFDSDDVTNDPQLPPMVVKNHCQTFDETIGVGDLAEKVKTIDGRGEMKRQVINAGKVIKLDQEKRFTGNFASVASVGTTVAGKFASAQAWITSNKDVGGATGGGYNPGTGLVSAYTGGTDRPFTAAIFKSTIQTAWTNGRGSLDTVICGGTLKVQISGLPGIVQATNEVSKTNVVVLGATDVYKSDFGFHKIMPSREMEAKAALILTPNTWKKGVLDSYNVKELAALGHSTRKLVRTTVTLKCLDEKQNALIRSVT